MRADAAAERQLQRLAHWKGGPLGEELSTLVTHVPEVVIRDDAGGGRSGQTGLQVPPGDPRGKQPDQHLAGSYPQDDHSDADSPLRNSEHPPAASLSMARALLILSLAANPPLFPCLAEQTLCEIEPLLCFCLLLLEALDITFQCLEPCSDVGRW